MSGEHLLQRGYDVVFEWGPEGVTTLAPTCDVIVIVDVLSFSTSVEIATARGATIFPYRWRDASAQSFADSVGAWLGGNNPAGLSLKPSSLESIEAGCRLVLPSPNGSTLSTLTGETTTIAGCLRNAGAVARHAAERKRIGVIAAGEIWPDGDCLRPAFEDQCGAGAIVHHLPGELTRSPEAQAASAVFEAARGDLEGRLLACASGREKQAGNLTRDVELAAALDTSDCIPVLRAGAYARCE